MESIDVNDEKLIEVLQIRCGPTLRLDLSRLADARDKAVGEYIRGVLEAHVYGEATLQARRAARAKSE